MYRSAESAAGPIADRIKKVRSVALVGHQGPDGDCVGVMMAMAEYLRSLGKMVSAFLPDAVPRFCRFLDPNGFIRLFALERDREAILRADLWICLDFSVVARMGGPAELFPSYQGGAVCIDHHRGSESFAEFMLVDPGAAATGLLVAELLDAWKVEWTVTLAQALYAALASDTGNFRHINTDPRALQWAARLVDLGASPPQVYHELYERWPPHRVRLLGRLIDSLEIRGNGGIAVFHTSQETLSELGATLEDLENFTDFGRLIDGVEVVAVVCERSNGMSKVSLRSTGRVNVSEIASALGGGGHYNAAGARMDLTLPEGLEAVRRGLDRGLKQALKHPPIQD